MSSLIIIICTVNNLLQLKVIRFLFIVNLQGGSLHFMPKITRNLATI